MKQKLLGFGVFTTLVLVLGVSSKNNSSLAFSHFKLTTIELTYNTSGELFKQVVEIPDVSYKKNPLIASINNRRRPPVTSVLANQTTALFYNVSTTEFPMTGEEEEIEFEKTQSVENDTSQEIVENNSTQASPLFMGAIQRDFAKHQIDGQMISGPLNDNLERILENLPEDFHGPLDSFKYWTPSNVTESADKGLVVAFEVPLFSFQNIVSVDLSIQTKDISNITSKLPIFLHAANESMDSPIGFEPGKLIDSVVPNPDSIVFNVSAFIKSISNESYLEGDFIRLTFKLSQPCTEQPCMEPVSFEIGIYEHFMKGYFYERTQSIPPRRKVEASEVIHKAVVRNGSIILEDRPLKGSNKRLVMKIEEDGNYVIERV